MRDEEARDSGRSDDGGDEKHLAAGARGDEEHAPSALADEGTQLRDGLLLVLPKVRRRGVLGEGARGEHWEGRGRGAARQSQSHPSTTAHGRRSHSMQQWSAQSGDPRLRLA